MIDSYWQLLLIGIGVADGLLMALYLLQRRTGDATYFDVVVGDRRAERAAWTYPEPTAPFEELRGYVAFYVAPMDRCTVDGEVAEPEERPYYGGWVTSDVLAERGA